MFRFSRPLATLTLFALTVTALPAVPLAAPAAADVPVVLTLDGRPVSKRPGMAVRHNGVLFVDVVDLTKVFDGLLVFDGPRTVKIALRGHTATFTVGSPAARIDGKKTKLPAAPLLRNGDIYIPMSVMVGPRTGIGLNVIDPTHADLHVAVFAPATEVPATNDALALELVPTASAAADGLHAALTITNTLHVPYTLRFPSSARATFTVDKDGSTAWDSSTGKRYLQTISQVTLAPGESVTYSDVWPDWTSAAPGRYQLRGQLMLKRPIASSPVSLGVVAPPQTK